MHRIRTKVISLIRLFLGHPVYWTCQVAGWGSVGAFNLLHILIGQARSPDLSLHISMLFLSGACLSHFYRFFIRLNGWTSLSWKQLLPRAVTACLLITALQSLWFYFSFPAELARIGDAGASPQAHLFGIAVFNFLLMTVWSGIYFGYHFHERYQKIEVDQLRLKVALREAEHRALSAQINPHFLFNSLNTLRSLINENPEKACEAVTELARLFRASLKTSRNNLITLRQEMETVRSYLSLEQSRFEERLIISDDIPVETLEAKLPPFLLQTLIENAIKYGDRGPLPTEISYRACLDSKGLTLQVTNPGHIRQKRDSTTGIGLENAQTRLHLLFGQTAFLKLTSPQEDVVQAEALIPQKCAES